MALRDQADKKSANRAIVMAVPHPSVVQANSLAGRQEFSQLRTSNPSPRRVQPTLFIGGRISMFESAFDTAKSHYGDGQYERGKWIN